MEGNSTVENITLIEWRNDYSADWWSIVVTTSVIILHSIIWMISTFGGIGTIKDLLCDLACATACDGWRNVDYVTEMAKFFSYWTFMPWIIVTYTGVSIIDGLLGLFGILFENSATMKAAMIIGIFYLLLAILLLIFFSIVTCFYVVCRCCIETTAKEVGEVIEAANLNEKHLAADFPAAEPNPAGNEPEEEEEPVDHNYCWNFFSHFAIPIFVYIVLYCVLLGRGWKFAFNPEITK